MSMIRATLSSLAKILSVRGDQVEDALASEQLARLSMDRRGFFRSVSVAAALVALPTGMVFSEMPAGGIHRACSLQDNLHAIDRINKVITFAFDGLFALDHAAIKAATARPLLRGGHPQQPIRAPSSRASGK